jgi:hypothetical protein
MTPEQRRAVKAGKKERIKELLHRLRREQPKPVDGEDKLREVLGLPEFKRNGC